MAVKVLIVIGLLFEGHWGYETEGAVASHWVIESFNIIENHASCLGSGGGDVPIEAFGFKGGPKGFRCGVIVAVPPATHALLD